MTKIKLTNETIINASEVKVENGVLKIKTMESTVEKLAELFSDKTNTSVIKLMTESETECGYKIGFTSFAGIEYNAEGNKTIELFQPVDDTERRISNLEGKTIAVNDKTTLLEEQNVLIATAIDSILTDIIPSLME